MYYKTQSLFGRIMKILQTTLCIAILMIAAGAVRAFELVMVEQAGCHWCQAWNEEIAPAYPNTPEGQFAPLRRVDLRAKPDDLIYARRVTFTPTFVLIKDGQEVARIEGYPGENFFWPLLDDMLRAHTNYTGETGS